MNVTENKTTMNHLGASDTYIVASFYMMFGIFGIIGNISIIIVILTSRVYRRRFSGLFLVNLAFADWLVCLTATPYYVTSLIMKPSIPTVDDPLSSEYNSICKLPMFFNYFTASLRILSLTAMSVDRYIAINHPYFYTRHCVYDISKSWGLFAVIYVWLQGLILMIPPMANNSLMAIVFFGSNGRLCGIMWSKSNFSFVAVTMLVNFVLPAICIVFTNCKVFWLARKQVVRERIKKQRSGRTFGFSSVRRRLKSNGAKNNEENKRRARVSIVVSNEISSKEVGNRREQNTKYELSTEGKTGHLNLPKSDNNKQKRSGLEVLNDEDASTVTMETIAPNAAMNNLPRIENQQTPSKRSGVKDDGNTGRQNTRTRPSRTSSDWEIALSTLALVIFYFISYLPFMITRLATLSSENSLSIEIVAYTTLLTTLDSAINPLIVLKTRREYRRILKKKICGRNSVDVDVTMWSSSKMDDA